MESESDDAVDEATAVDEPTFAEGLFSGSRFCFWTLGPLSLFVGASMFLTMDGSWSTADVTRAVLGALCVLFALGLMSPRLGWCARGATAIVFAFCAVYLVEAWQRERATPGAGDVRLGDAIRAMLVFGLPSLWFTLRGRRR